MVDEERKININKAEQIVLQSLNIAPEIVESIRAWRGDPKLTPDVKAKEDAYYQSLEKPYKIKGKEFECLEELLLVRGVTPELLFGRDLDGDGVISVNEQGLIRYLTVYGKDGQVNINTADTTVLQALGFTGELAEKIVRYRSGIDGILGTGDDPAFGSPDAIVSDLNYFEPLLTEEIFRIDQLKPLLKVKSQYYTACVEGVAANGVKSKVIAVIDKDADEGSQIVKWEEQ
jgi:DNA uptake protein ComE-like DNA-binding protein